MNRRHWGQKRYNDRFAPYLRPLPAPLVGIFDTPTVCVNINREWVPQIVCALNALSFDFAWQIDDTFDVLQQVEELIASMHKSDCKPKKFYGRQFLPDCIEINTSDSGIEINIREGDCMTPVTVNIYDGCGCGDAAGSLSSGNAGNLSSGKLSGTNSDLDLFTPTADRRISTCDIASYLAPYILTQAKEFFQAIATSLNAGEDVTDSLLDGTLESSVGAIPIVGDVVSGIGATAIDIVTTLATLAPENLVSMLDDSDFVLKFQQAFVASLGNQNSITSLTRDDLQRVAANLPLTWFELVTPILPRLVFNLFFRVVNMEKINVRLSLARDKADDALCEYLFSQVGEVYTPQPALITTKPIRSTLLNENSLYQLLEIEVAGNSGNYFVNVGDLFQLGEFSNLLAVGFKATLTGGSSFGNAITLLVRMNEITLMGQTFGGSVEGIGEQTLLTSGDGNAITYLINTLPEFFGGGSFVNVVPSSGMLDIYAGTQQADWSVVFDEFYIVVGK